MLANGNREMEVRSPKPIAGSPVQASYRCTAAVLATACLPTVRLTRTLAFL